MKNLKYIIFTFLACFFAMTPAIAKEELMVCTYGKLYIDNDRTQSIKYRVTYYDDNTVKHEYVPSDRSDYIKGGNNHQNVGVFDDSGKRVSTASGVKDNVSAEEMKKYYNKKTCPYIVFKSLNTSPANRSITPVETNDLSKYTNGDERAAAISASNGFYRKPDGTSSNENAGTNNNQTTGNNGTSNNNGNNQNSTGNQTTGNTETNNKENSGVKCTYAAKANFGITYSDVEVVCNATNTSLTCNSSLSISHNSLKITDFKSGNNFVCPKNVSIDVNSAGVISDITLTGGTDKLTLTEEKPQGSSSGGNTPTPVTPTKPVISEDTFCQGRVQGVFTTLGWVFFVLKILVPIILIIFGIIDFSKAMIVSKDDEIKKATKSIIIRAIAGIIIFFIPSLLGFIVGMIDSSDIYKGTFWDCTKCMLNPSGETCSGLRGE